MRALIACTALASTAFALAACGSAGSSENKQPARSDTTMPASGGKTQGSGSTSVSGAVDGDNDDDSSLGGVDNDGDRVLAIGQAAGPAERQQFVGLVRRYYAAAAAGRGAETCSLLYAPFAETIVEAHETEVSPNARGASACAQVVSKLLDRAHRTLRRRLARLQIGEAQISGNAALVRVRTAPVSEYLVRLHRERGSGSWKVDTLADELAV